MLQRLAQRAGIEKRVHAHGLRHSLAVELVRKGVHARDVQAQLGHKNLATTNVYLSGLLPQESLDRVRAAMEPEEAEAPEDKIERLERAVAALTERLEAADA